MMHRSMSILALAACTLTPLASFAAATPVTSDNNANIAPVKGQMVKVTLKNVGNGTQNLSIQGRQVILGAGDQKVVEVPAGTQVLGADQSVKLTIVREYNNATASFR